jgi:RNA polymerase sigma factor (sigma-70 family)
MVRDSLLADCIRKDPRAEHELYKTMYPMMMSICSRYERNRQDASARMNDGFLKVLLNLKKRRPEVPFELWARRIMINTVIDNFRKERERKAHETMDVPVNEHVGTEVNDYLRQMEAGSFRGAAPARAGDVAQSVQPLRHRRLQPRRDRGNARHQRGHIEVACFTRAANTATSHCADRRHRNR